MQGQIRFLVLAILFIIPQSGNCKTIEYKLVISTGSISVGDTLFQNKFLVNGSIPAPELTFHYGDTARITVVNTTNKKTLIHWHGILLPNEMDGVPYVNSLPIDPHSKKVYQFPIKQTGTYWYHSHVMFQEEDGIYGALKLLPRENALNKNDSTVIFADLAHESGSMIQRNLKRDGEYYDLFKDTVQSWLKAFMTGSSLTKWRNSLQRMEGMDYADVAYDYFTANGQPQINIYRQGQLPQKVRLRLINGSATSLYKLTYAGGPFTVIAADGLPVEPVKVNILPISIAETYDIIVETDAKRRLELRATSLDNSGYSSILIGAQSNSIQYAPEMPWEQPIGFTMGKMMGMPQLSFWQEFLMSYKNEFQDLPTDIGSEIKKNYSLPTQSALMPMMDHEKMTSDETKSRPHNNHYHHSDKPHTMNKEELERERQRTQDRNSLPKSQDNEMTQLEIARLHLKYERENFSKAESINKDTTKASVNSLVKPKTHNAFRIMNQAPETLENNYLGEDDGISYLNELTYGALRARVPINTKTDKALRIIPFTLNGNMENYVWTINGRPLGPESYILIKKGERVRFVMKNTTMMNHPMHLHGHFFRVMTEQGKWSVLKHTVNVAPLSTTVIEFAASEEKDWFFHCHMLYHMMDGMSRIVRYKDQPGPQEFIAERSASAEFNFPHKFFFRNKILAQSNYSRIEGKFFNSYYQFEYDILGNFEGNYEGEVHLARTFTRFLSLYVGGRIEQQGNMASESSPTVGLTWLLPLNIGVDLKYQPMRDDKLWEIEFKNVIQLSDKLQMNLEYSSIRNFYAEFEWRQTKHLSLSANYNQTFRTLGVGLGYTY